MSSSDPNTQALVTGYILLAELLKFHMYATAPTISQVPLTLPALFHSTVELVYCLVWFFTFQLSREYEPATWHIESRNERL